MYVNVCVCMGVYECMCMSVCVCVRMGVYECMRMSVSENACALMYLCGGQRATSSAVPQEPSTLFLFVVFRQSLLLAPGSPVTSLSPPPQPGYRKHTPLHSTSAIDSRDETLVLMTAQHSKPFTN